MKAEFQITKVDSPADLITTFSAIFAAAGPDSQWSKVVSRRLLDTINPYLYNLEPEFIQRVLMQLEANQASGTPINLISRSKATSGG